MFCGLLSVLVPFVLHTVPAALRLLSAFMMFGLLAPFILPAMLRLPVGFAVSGLFAVPVMLAALVLPADLALLSVAVLLVPFVEFIVLAAAITLATLTGAFTALAAIEGIFDLVAFVAVFLLRVSVDLVHDAVDVAFEVLLALIATVVFVFHSVSFLFERSTAKSIQKNGVSSEENTPHEMPINLY